MVSLLGYIVGFIYLVYCGLAIYSLKGVLWLLVSLAGPIVIFPIWGYLLLGYSEPGVWIMFFYLVVDAIFTKRKLEVNIKNDNNYYENNSVNSNDIQYSSEIDNEHTLEIKNLKSKLEDLNSEDELRSLKDQLNKKRLERGLISLTEYEQLEQDIKNKRKIYKAQKTDYFEIIDEKKSAKTELIFGTLVLTPLSLFMYIFGFNSNVWFLTALGVLSVLILIYNFSSKSKYINWSNSEIERLTIEKDSSLKELKKLKKIYKNQTI